jgi:hypothetical protein
MYAIVISVGRRKLDKLRDRVITRTKSVQGGWKPNMWGSYPRHEMGKVSQMPKIDWIPEAKPRRPELAERTKKRDPFRSGLDAEYIDDIGQKSLS